MSISNLNDIPLDLYALTTSTFCDNFTNNIYMGVSSRTDDKFGYFINAKVTEEGDGGLHFLGKTSDKSIDTPIMSVYSELSSYQKRLVRVDNLLINGNANLGGITNFSVENTNFTLTSNIVYINNGNYRPFSTYSAGIPPNINLVLQITDLALNQGGNITLCITTEPEGNNTFNIRTFLEAGGAYTGCVRAGGVHFTGFADNIILLGYTIIEISALVSQFSPGPILSVQILYNGVNPSLQ